MVIDIIIPIGLDLDIPHLIQTYQLELMLFFLTVSESQKYKYSNKLFTLILFLVDFIHLTSLLIVYYDYSNISVHFIDITMHLNASLLKYWF